MRLLPVISAAILLLSPAVSAHNVSAAWESGPIQIASNAKDIVDFNTATLKYHDPNCIWAKRCTVHCIKISRAEAKQRGGVPCKVCGGGE